MNLSYLIKGIDFEGDIADCNIESINYDSRKVKEGSLFFAIKGINVDGNNFIEEAIDNGAVAVITENRLQKLIDIPIIQVKFAREVMSKVCSRFYKNPSKNINIMGTTGTNGKTSVTHILHHIITSHNESCGSLGTLGFQIPSGIINTGFTTPESVELHQMLNTLKNAQIKNLVMEVSSHALELYRVNDIDIDIAIFTNLTSEHLDFHGDMESYLNSKIKLFQSLNNQKFAIINLDDPYFEDIKKSTKAKVVTYGFHKDADIAVADCLFSINGIIASLKFDQNYISINTNLIGDYNLSNIMAAVSASLCKGFSIKTIEQAINTLPPIPGRMERIPSECPGQVFIDYAHTPDAYEKVFSSISSIVNDNTKIISLFGCGGNRDKKNRSKVAKISEHYSDYSFVTTDNPRNENINNINQDIIKGFTNNNFKIITNRKEAIELALSQMQDDYVLLILGKGRENYQEVCGKKQFHSDIEIIRDYSYAS